MVMRGKNNKDIMKAWIFKRKEEQVFVKFIKKTLKMRNEVIFQHRIE